MKARNVAPHDTFVTAHKRTSTSYSCYCTCHRHQLAGDACHTSLICVPRRDTGARMSSQARQCCTRWARFGRRVIPMPAGHRRTAPRARLERAPPSRTARTAASGTEGSGAKRVRKKATTAAPKGAASIGIVRRILRTGRWCRALNMGTRGAEVQQRQRACDVMQGAGPRSGGVWGDYLQRGLS